MTQKREPFLIDLKDDTDSDSADAIQIKAWKTSQEWASIAGVNW